MTLIAHTVSKITGAPALPGGSSEFVCIGLFDVSWYKSIYKGLRLVHWLEKMEVKIITNHQS